jgi:hypothetical protein
MSNYGDNKGDMKRVQMGYRNIVDAVITSDQRMGTMRVGAGSKVHRAFGVTATVITEGRFKGREVNLSDGVWCSTYRNSDTVFSVQHSMQWEGEITCLKCNPDGRPREDIEAEWQRRVKATRL